MNRLNAVFLLMWVFVVGWSQSGSSYVKGYLVAKFYEENSLKTFNEQFSTLLAQLKVKEIKPLFPWSRAYRDTTFYKHPAASSIRRMVEIILDTSVILDFVIPKLLRTGFFEYVEKSPIPETFYTPDDAYITNQYYLHNIKALQAWDIWKGDTNTVMGIVDTGIDFTHPDLWASIKYNANDPIDGQDNDNDGFVDNYYGWDFGTNDNNPQYQTLGHGVHVAGIAGATADNQYGMAGVGFRCKILPLKVDNAYGSLTGAYAGLVYAAEHGAKVINCSWGSTVYTQAGQDIVDYVTEVCGSLVVAACGNTGGEANYYPASYRYVLSVAATDINDVKWSNSSFSDHVDLSAPGKDIYSTWPGPGFVFSSGTSMAAPMVTAAAALVASYFPNLTMLQVAERLRTTADLIDTIPANLPYQGKMGKGRLNIYRALTEPFDSPSVRLLSYRFSDNNDDFFVPGDTIRLIFKFINYLAPTSNQFFVAVSTTAPNVNLLFDTLLVGVLQPLQMYENLALPFKIKLGNVQPNQIINIKIEFIDPVLNYSEREYVTLVVNRDYLSLNINKINVTVTSRGNFAYNDYPMCLQGEGLRFQNSPPLVAMFGLLAGSSTVKVSDNLFGVSTVNNDFKTIDFVIYQNPPLWGDQALLSHFSDSSAINPNYIEVFQTTYAYQQSTDDNYFISTYNIINKGSQSSSNFYVGFFADWDIGPSTNNRSLYHTGSKSLITFDLDSSYFIAMKILDQNNTFAYACDLDGWGGSIAITDGFTEVEKYTMMQTNRYAAGMDLKGNDVAAMVSCGPFTLSPSDTLKVSLLTVVGKNFNQTISSVNHATNRFFNPYLSVNEFHQKLSFYPNPVSDQQIIFFIPVRLFYRVALYSLQGNRLGQILWNDDYSLKLPDLLPGMYYLVLTNERERIVLPLIITQ